MNRYALILIFTLLILCLETNTFAQTAADSVTITFRTFKNSSSLFFVPGEFNGWGPNSSGVISAGAISQMTYNGALGGWIKTYTFKIHAASETRRTLGDSVFQYKFNQGGGQSSWYSDPLNPETNGGDNGNSILRLKKFFWFEVNLPDSGGSIKNIFAGLVHANSDTIVSVLLSYGATSASTLTTIDITSYYNDSLRLMDYSLLSSFPKTNYVRLAAYNNHGDSTVYEKAGYVISYLAMPSYVGHAVTLPSGTSNDSTSFRINVSPQDYVLLKIAPLGQNPSTATPILMRRNYDSDSWWINVKLASGTYEYLYQFSDGSQIYDPWGRYNGTYGSRFTVGGAGITADDYQWHNTTWQRPPLNKLVIYEMNLSEVLGGYYHESSWTQHNFKDLIQLLPYYDSLGINCLELMPINDFAAVGSSGFSWGYDLNSDLALEPSYGNPADFKTLVDSAHGRGIAIIIDAVFNHLNGTGALWQMMPKLGSNPYFKAYGSIDPRPNESTTDLFQDLDHWTTQTQEYVYSALKNWIDQYHVDGFRYDFTTGIGWDAGAPTKGVPGWTYKIKSDYGGQIYQIAEHLSENPAIFGYSGLTGGWHESFRRRVFEEAAAADVPLDDIDSLVLGLGAYQGSDVPKLPFPYTSRTQPVNMTVDHDELTMLYQMTKYAGISDSVARLRDKLYNTFIFTSMGIPFLWEGMEHAEPRGWANSDARMSFRPVQWNLGDSAFGQNHFQHFKKLIFQRLHNPALYEGTKHTLAKYGLPKTIVWGYDDSLSSAKVMIVANMRPGPQTLTNVPWLDSGTWYDIFDQSTITVNGNSIDTFIIPGFNVRVYSNKSNDMLLLGVNDKKGSLPVSYDLKQNYPNPFNPATQIEFSLKEKTHANLTIYDILGRQVATLVNGELAPGVHHATWYARNAASGVYFYRLSTPKFSAVQKMILAR
jgi:1,4-alpha-glucan branching enzyme